MNLSIYEKIYNKNYLDFSDSVKKTFFYLIEQMS